MRQILILALLAGGMVSGCTQRSAPAPTSSEAPEPTSEQIVAELRQCVAPLASLVVATPGVVGWGDSGRGAAAVLSDEAKEQVLSCLRSAKTKYGTSDAGNAALGQISDDLDKVIVEAMDQERWRVALCAIDGYEILIPNSLKMARFRERAQVRADRPDVVVKGFFEDKEKKDVYVFIQVTERPGKQVHNVQVRKGEEFYGLRLVDFIGKLKGVVLEYLDIPGETFRAMGP